MPQLDKDYKPEDYAVLQQYRDNLKLSSQNWNAHFAQAEDDLRMYLGDQLTTRQKQNLQNGKPALVINFLKKRVDILVGQQMQAKTDIKVFPVEGEDDRLCSIYTELIKWIFVKDKSQRKISQAFRNSNISGLGWMSCEVDFSKDIINGDITIKNENPFRIMADPNFKEMDLSDCRYIIRCGLVSKDEAKELWPNHKDILDGITSAVLPTEFNYNEPPTDNLKGYVTVTEYWYRTFEESALVIDTTSGDSIPMDKEKAIFLTQNNPVYTMVTTRKQVIKVMIIANGQHILYHGANPFMIDKYPFVPIMYSFTPEIYDYSWRFQGIIRPLKDLQHEKNKRRSVILHSTMSMASSGYIVEEGSVMDESQLSGGPGRIIRYRKGYNPPQPIQPPLMQNSLMELEAKAEQDMMAVGLNPETMGMRQEADTPGIVTQLRQKQGMTAVQECFDNLSFAMTAIGRLCIEYINAFWSRDKVEAVAETQVPPDWDMIKYSYQHDCMVDEVLSTPTSRIAVYMQLMEMFRNGIPVDPRLLVSKMEIAADEKEALIQFIDKQMQPPPPAPGMAPGPQQIPQGM